MTTLFKPKKPPAPVSKTVDEQIIKPAPMPVDTTVSPALRAEARNKQKRGSVARNRREGGSVNTTLGAGSGGAYTA